MSVTRFLSLFLALTLLVALCCIPAFAADGYSFIYNPDFSTNTIAAYTSTNASVPLVGDYNYLFTVSHDGITDSYSGVNTVIMLDIDGISFTTTSILIGDNTFSIAFMGDLMGLTVLESSKSISGYEDYFFSLELHKISHPGFVESINLGIDGVISWIQEVTSSITTGPLLPLLGMMAVAICITGILFSVKFIRKSSWGH